MMQHLSLIDMKNWMKEIPDEKKITEINIPGTHDSATCFVAFSFISRTQHLTVDGQLEKGVRYFDFRFRYEKGRFVASHSIATCKKSRGIMASELTADDIVNSCVDFLKKNPHETILFQLKETVSHKGNDFYTDFFEKYIKNNPQCWYVKNAIPTMGEVRGKIVLLRVVGIDKNNFDDSNSGIDFTSYPYVGTKNVDAWQNGDICSIETGKAYAKMLVQDSYKVEGKKKWGTVSRFLKNGDKCDFNICLTSCTCFFVPSINVRYINRQLEQYEFEKGRLYGIVASDYIDSKICSKIIESNFS